MAAAPPHVYVDSDVPARMKLTDWRRKHTPRPPRGRRRLLRRILHAGE